MPVWIAPNGYFVTHAQSGEAKLLAKLHADNFYRGWGEAEFEAYIVQKNIFTYVVRRKSKKLVGMLVVREAAGEAEILSIAIARKSRKKGFARALMNAAFDELARYGVREIFLEVNEDNLGARQLYARYGFETVATRPQYYQSGASDSATALVMRCNLG